jgi:hypothetical protein
MKLGRWAWLICLVIPSLTGCDSFWTPLSPTPSGGCTTNCTTASSGNFYILNAGTSPAIVGQSIVTGKLTAISGSPWTLAGSPFAIAISPGGNFLYASTIAGVYVYPISGGALGKYAQVSQDVTALAIQVDATGTWLIEALQATGGVTLAAIPLNSSTGGSIGAAQTVSFNITNAAVQGGKIALSSDNKFVFVALGAGGAIAVPFNAGVNTGQQPFGNTAFTIPVLKTGGSALSVAVDPGLRLFYIGETLANSTGDSGGLRAFNYASLGGTLKQASGSPIAAGGLAPNSILPAGAGDYVYVANGQGTTTSGNIASFAVTGTDGAYTIAAGSSIGAGQQPISLAEDSTSTFLLGVNNLGGPFFSSFTFNATTAGKLDIQIVANTGNAPQAIVAAPLVKP